MSSILLLAFVEHDHPTCKSDQWTLLFMEQWEIEKYKNWINNIKWIKWITARKLIAKHSFLIYD